MRMAGDHAAAAPVEKALRHASDLLEHAAQHAGEAVLDMCTKPVLSGVAAASTLPAGVQRLVHGDVERLHSAVSL